MLSSEHRVAILTPASTAAGDRIRHLPAVCIKRMNSLQTSGVSLGFIQTCAGVSKANWVIRNLLPTEPSAFEDEAVATAATRICVTLLIPCDSAPRSPCTQLSYPYNFFVPVCLLAMLRAAQDSYVAMLVQSLTSHCWSRESTRIAPALRADTRRRRSLQLVRETVSMERKGLESKKLTFGLEKQSFINLRRKNGRWILGRWLEGGRQVDSNDPIEHTLICCLKREA